MNAASAANSAWSSRTILISPGIVENLRAEGYEVHTVGDGQAALDLAAEPRTAVLSCST